MKDDIETLRDWIISTGCTPNAAFVALERVEKEYIQMRSDWSALIRQRQYAEADRDSSHAKLERAKEALVAWQEWWDLPWEAKRPDIAQLRYNRARAILSELSADAPAESLDEKCERLKSQHETAKSRDACRRLSADAPAQQTQISDGVREAMVEVEKALAAIASLPTENVNGGRDNATSKLNGGWAVKCARDAIAKLRSVMKWAFSDTSS